MSTLFNKVESNVNVKISLPINEQKTNKKHIFKLVNTSANPQFFSHFEQSIVKELMTVAQGHNEGQIDPSVWFRGHDVIRKGSCN